MRNKGESGCRGLFTLGRVSSRLIIALMQGFIHVGIKLYWVMCGVGENVLTFYLSFVLESNIFGKLKKKT